MGCLTAPCAGLCAFEQAAINVISHFPLLWSINFQFIQKRVPF